MAKYRRVLIGIVVVVVVGLLIIQVVPVMGRTNPPVQSQLKWSSPEGEKLARAACFDCHSNETVWPWYSYIAPISWLTVHDVQEGRQKLNFSDLSAGEVEMDEITGQIQRGAMPPAYYMVTHPDARLTDQQKSVLIAAIQSALTSPTTQSTSPAAPVQAPTGDDDEDGG